MQDLPVSRNANGARFKRRARQQMAAQRAETPSPDLIGHGRRVVPIARREEIGPNGARSRRRMPLQDRGGRVRTAEREPPRAGSQRLAEQSGRYAKAHASRAAGRKAGRSERDLRVAVRARRSLGRAAGEQNVHSGVRRGRRPRASVRHVRSGGSMRRVPEAGRRLSDGRTQAGPARDRADSLALGQKQEARERDRAVNSVPGQKAVGPGSDRPGNLVLELRAPGRVKGRVGNLVSGRKEAGPGGRLALRVAEGGSVRIAGHRSSRRSARGRRGRVDFLPGRGGPDRRVTGRSATRGLPPSGQPSVHSNGKRTSPPDA